MKRLTVTLLPLLLAASTCVADELEQYTRIRELLVKQEYDAAEKSLAAGLDEFPDSARLKALHLQFSLALKQAGRKEDAARHVAAYVDYQLGQLERSARLADSFAASVSRMTTAFLDAGQPELAEQKLAAAIAGVEALPARDALTQLAIQLQGHKAVLLHATGRAEDARQLIDDVFEKARAGFEEQADDTSAALALAAAWQARSLYLHEVDATASDQAARQGWEFLAEQAGKHPADAELVNAYYRATTALVAGLARNQPDQAEEILKRAASFFNSTPTEPVKALAATWSRNQPSYQRTINAAKEHQALLGQDALPLAVQAWVNGEPLTDSDLKGKVVLLDFWAVWCGPCIATFPHLREWQEKYGAQGLVIIGLTNYYQYDWDDEAGRSKRLENLSNEKERAGLVKFAAHHQLKHVFGIMSSSKAMSSGYGVTGIPQAVLIDRAGKIRMIRVGSGEQNAHDLAQLLEKLIAE